MKVSKTNKHKHKHKVQYSSIKRKRGKRKVKRSIENKPSEGQTAT